MTSATDPKTILISTCGGIKREGKAGGAITPGMLLNVRDVEALVAHDEAGQECQVAIAVEYDLTGRNITQAYANGDQVMYHVLPDGDRFYGIIGGSQDIAIGDLVTSNGFGHLAEAAATDFVIGIARTAAVTGVGETARCIIEVAKGRGIA